jgi:hypothetical protein
MMPIEEAIIEKLRSGPCRFDDVVTGLPNFGWGELFVAVDRMSRDGRVFLRQLGFSTYQISLGSRRTEFSSAASEKGLQSSLSGKTVGERPRRGCDDEDRSGMVERLPSARDVVARR